jgi:hypothetical protein
MVASSSRRTFLVTTCGVLAGGTAAALVCKHYWKGQPKGATSEYTRVRIDPRTVRSDLSSPEVEKAYEILLNERDMWLRLKEVSRDARVETEITEPDKGKRNLTHRGTFSIRLADARSDAAKRSPYTCQLDYRDAHNNNTLWTYVLNENGQSVQFANDGDKVEAADPHLLVAMFTVGYEVFASLRNSQLTNAAAAWNPYSNPQAKGVPASYVFKQPGTDAARMQVAFVNGHFSEFHPPARKGCPTVSIHVTETAFPNNVWYPTEVEFHAVEKNSVVNVLEKSVTCLLHLSNLHVVTA